MAGDLGRGDAFVGDPVQRQLVEHAVGAVGLDQPLDRQQRRGQRRHPQHPGADAGEQAGVGTDRERHKDRDEKEEGGREPRLPGERAAHFASEQAADHAASSSLCQSPASGKCEATTTAPPLARCCSISFST